MIDVAELLSWANLTAQLFNVSRDRALELAVDLQDKAGQRQSNSSSEPQESPASTVGVTLPIAEMTARILRHEIGCSIVNGRLSYPERRRVVAMKARQTGSRSGSKIADMLFDMKDLIPADRKSLVRAINDDLTELNKMGALTSQSLGNGLFPPEDDLVASHLPPVP